MLELVPSLMSRRSTVLRDGVEVAAIEASWFREAAEVTIEGVPHTIRREGLASGSFTLARDGAVIARARKHSALRSRFELEHAVHRYELRKSSWWGRSFELLLDGQPVGSIRPKSPFTRRATIELPPDLPLAVQVFLAALVAFMWNREASAGAG